MGEVKKFSWNRSFWDGWVIQPALSFLLHYPSVTFSLSHSITDWKGTTCNKGFRNCSFWVAAATIHAFSLLNAASDSSNRDSLRGTFRPVELVSSYRELRPILGWLLCSSIRQMELVCFMHFRFSDQHLRLSALTRHLRLSALTRHLRLSYAAFRRAGVFTLGGTHSELLLVSGY